MLDLGVPDAWTRERGSVVVAIVDNGIDIAHPDLADQLWSNPLEAPNGVDDDGDGRVDDIHGWNFLDEDGDVSVAPEGPGRDRHGTAVAGIVAAQTDNGIGVAGGCPGCRLMILKARDFDRVNTVVPRLAEAIDYAVTHGAKVVSISDGVPAGSAGVDTEQAVEAAIERAAEAGVLVVASAGTDGAYPVRFPASLPGVLAVAAVDDDSAPTAWTSYGVAVDVAAPGTFIFTTTPDGSYDYFDGTSASAPITAALAALLASKHPDWSVAQIVDRIRSTTSPARFDGREDLAGRFGAGIISFRDGL
jgi:subtilisin family serine protease